MLNYKLPEILWPSACEGLQRLGRDYDGGYLVNITDVQSSDFLVSCGIYDDWSFEQDFLVAASQRSSIPSLIALDPTVGKGFFWRRVQRSLPRVLKPKLVLRDIAKLVDYYTFFDDKARIHLRKYVGAPHLNNSVSLEHLTLSRFANKKGFLKVDIEGSEYRVFEELLSIQHVIQGLAIELHDVDLHLPKICEFVKNFELRLVHVHPNNYGGVDRNGIPLVLELTFSRNVVSDDVKVEGLPHMLDMNNNQDGEDYFFEGVLRY